MYTFDSCFDVMSALYTMFLDRQFPDRVQFSGFLQLQLSAASVDSVEFFIVCIYDSFHVIHAAVAYFNIVLVKDFVKFTSFWKVFFNDLYEFSADVSKYVWNLKEKDIDHNIP